MMNCRTCGHPIEAFMSYGRMPIANGFLTPAQFDQEKFFELAPAFCEKCATFQIVDQPDAQDMFHENYAFFTRTSAWMVKHFGTYAEYAYENWVAGKTDPFVVELGSNDGAMLENFTKRDIRHLGVEPSANVAAVAREHGVNSLCAFFGEETAKKIVTEHGKADVIMAANVMCHIPDLKDVARGFDALLKDDGVFMFEDPYLGDMVAKTSYDQIYDEHVYIFSAHSVKAMFEPFGFELIDVLAQTTHGGSMRYVFGRKDQHRAHARVTDLLDAEIKQGLTKFETFQKFAENCETSKRELVQLLKELKAQGKRVVGYGATSKSTTVLNYCQIGPDLIEFISDTTPIKQGKLTPGMHIPVQPYDNFKVNYPDYAVLFAWNHGAEIRAKEDAFRESGGQWILYVPKVSVE
jgi:methylation protein EvaC